MGQGASAVSWHNAFQDWYAVNSPEIFLLGTFDPAHDDDRSRGKQTAIIGESQNLHKKSLDDGPVVSTLVIGIIIKSLPLFIESNFGLWLYPGLFGRSVLISILCNNPFIIIAE